MARFLPLLTALIFGLSACDIFDSEEEAIPSFVHVEKIDLETTEDEGSDSHNITSAHIYANDQFVGAIEPPGTVAVYKAGITRISVRGGIKNNGLSEARIVYPNYQAYEANITLIPGEVVDFSEDSVNAGPGSGRRSYPVLHYYDDLQFHIEDFETPASNIDTTALSLATVVKTSEPSEAFEGTSAKIVLDDTNYFFEATSSWDADDLPFGYQIFLEFDYKNNIPFEVGILSNDPSYVQTTAIGILESQEWNKIYVDLSEEIGIEFNANNIEVYFQAVLPANMGSGEIYLDNIKMVYFPL